MVNWCSIKGCSNNSKIPGIKLHRVPKDNIGKDWTAAIQKVNPDFVLTAYSVICSDHFDVSDYLVRGKLGNAFLKKNAIPSIFNTNPKKAHIYKVEEFVVFPSPSIINDFNEDSGSIECFYDEKDLPSCSVTDLPEHNSEVKISKPDGNYAFNTISPETPEKSNSINMNNSLITPEFAKSRKRKCFIGDFTDEDLNSPKRQKKFLNATKKMLFKKRKQIKTLQKQKGRLIKKIRTMKQLMTHLREEKNLISQNCFSHLQETLPDIENEILMKQLKIKSSKKISPELRTFALTLNFYSPSAYNYVRLSFNKVLPHPSTLRKWYSTIDGSPGFTSEALNAIKIKSDEMLAKGKQLVCGLIMDEMYIKENIHYNGKRLQGYINYGIKTDEVDGLPKAREALVFLLVAINSHWKIPIAYFLTNGLNTQEKANLVNTVLSFVHDKGVCVKTLTFDGAATNISMSACLGANLTMPCIKSYFTHPETKQKVHIFLDPAHMLKLCRNTLGDWGVLYDKSGQLIKWVYFKELVSIQDKTGLHCGTKIRSRHINYQKEKMKVKLACQTFSSSVADAFLYCSDVLKLEAFKNVNSTITFCKNINNIFDFLNTRNFLTKGQFKKPLRAKDEENILTIIEESIEYIKSLQVKIENKFVPLIKSARKTGFLGLIVCLQSVKEFFFDVIKTGTLDFFLTYKISQDHVEILFSNIRSMGGFNNNPTASQFEAAYKRLIIHTELKVSKEANCQVLDCTPILTVSSNKKIENRIGNLDLICAEDYEETDTFENINYNYELMFVDDVIQYIAGFVVRKLYKQITCNMCLKLLSDDIMIPKKLSLLDIKNRGGLTKPTKDMTYLCKTAEITFRTFQQTLPSIKYDIIEYLTIKATSKLQITNIFNEISEHILDQSPLDNHLLQLIKMSFQCYFKIRVHHHNLTISQPQQRIRSSLTKIIHFKNQ